jgi:hypothetical protein
MTRQAKVSSEIADYDDAPTRRPADPLGRIARGVGCLTTIILGGLVVFVQGRGADLEPSGVLWFCGVVSFASIPLIMYFWHEELRLKGSILKVAGVVSLVSIACWAAQVAAFLVMIDRAFDMR